MACFSASQTAWASASQNVNEKMTVRFFHWFCLTVLVILLFKQIESVFLFVLVSLAIFITAEIIPICYARRKPEKVYKIFKGIVKGLSSVTYPITHLLDKLDASLDGKAEQNEKTFSIENLSSALDVVSQQKKETQESKILKGIVRFAETEASSIMTPRINMVSVSLSVSFYELMKIMREAGYSRMPVFNGNLDHISGLLYIKDVLPHLQQKADFEWQKLIRPAMFVPETKKIDVLLRELQDRRVHLAIVVNEYGGTSGLISLEDILEEVVGEISDEFDGSGEVQLYKKTDNNTYVFDAGMPVHDFCKLMSVKDDFFEEYEGEYETLAGFILEKLGRFPTKGETVSAPPFMFTVEAIDSRRIRKIKMIIDDDN